MQIAEWIINSSFTFCLLKIISIYTYNKYLIFRHNAFTQGQDSCLLSRQGCYYFLLRKGKNMCIQKCFAIVPANLCFFMLKESVQGWYKGWFAGKKAPFFLLWNFCCCCFWPNFGLLGHQVGICKITHPLRLGDIEHSCHLSYQLRIKARKQTNQNLKKQTCLSHNNYWIMQILTRANQAGASISGRKVQQGEGSDWEIRSALPPSVKKWTGLTSAGLANGMYPLKQGLGEQNILVGWYCITGVGRRQWLGKGFPVSHLQSGQSAVFPPVRSSLGFSSLVFHLRLDPWMSLYITTRGDKTLFTQVSRSSGQLDSQQRWQFCRVFQRLIGS